MRFSHFVLVLTVLCLAAVPAAYAEETMSGSVFIVTYFDVAPTATAQSTAIARQYAEASRKEDGNAGFDVFEETARPSRFAILEVWRDKKAADAHAAGAAAAAFREKLEPLMVGGFGVRPHSGFAVAPPASRLPGRAIYVLTHVDVFPANKDQAIELVKAQAAAARRADGNLRFDVLQWDGHPNHFTLVEVWRDRKALDANAASAHTRDFRQKLTPLEGALYDERLYQALR